MSVDSEDAGFLNFGEDLVDLPVIKSAGTSEVDFDGILQSPLRLHEDLKNGCGGQLWPAGMVLAKYLLRNPGLCRDKTIVELGAGGGLVGLALALQRQSFKTPLWITDQDPMFALMKRNISLNNLNDLVKAEVYDWGKATPSSLPQYPDVILAADCVYFEPAFPLLQKTLQDLIGPNTVCYFCFKKRRRADLHFVKSIKKLFTVIEVGDDPDKSTWSKEALFLYEIRKK